LKGGSDFKIVLSNEWFETQYDDGKRDRYILDELDSLRIRKRVNWVVSVLSFLIEVLIWGAGHAYKERDLFRFN
jgi:hypothetical protein